LISQWQSEHRTWLDKNFPNQQLHDPLLGIVEEVGELAHAHLKASQQIREYARAFDEAKFLHAATDALGDIFIYMMSYCNSNGIDLEVAIEQTWSKVSTRDWISDPTTGGEMGTDAGTVEQVPDDVLDDVVRGEEVPGEEPPTDLDPDAPEDDPPLNGALLFKVARGRYDRMVARGSKTADKSFAAYLTSMADSAQEAKNAFSTAVRAEAATRLERVDELGIGNTARKHLLAAMVEAGRFDVEEEDEDE
jgi:NTP pyrophosphatase (non-canonical NTP hydrolase)